jgi:hypothetical protein
VVVFVVASAKWRKHLQKQRIAEARMEEKDPPPDLPSEEKKEDES